MNKIDNFIRESDYRLSGWRSDSKLQPFFETVNMKPEDLQRYNCFLDAYYSVFSFLWNSHYIRDNEVIIFHNIRNRVIADITIVELKNFEHYYSQKEERPFLETYQEEEELKPVMDFFMLRSKEAFIQWIKQNYSTFNRVEINEGNKYIYFGYGNI